jgi:hypothetical protein
MAVGISEKKNKTAEIIPRIDKVFNSNFIT